MAVCYKTIGFIFKKQDRNENDRVFSVFTDGFGRLEILGKAIRKINSKLRRGIDIFSLSEIGFIQGKSQKTLTEAFKLDKFGSITQNPQKFLVACRISGLMDNFIKGQEPDENIYNLLIETFKNLNNFPISKFPNFSLAYQYFFWNFFSELGYRPEVGQCAVCRQKLNPYGVYFSSKEGGIVCKKCAVQDKNTARINSDAVKILRLILNKDKDTVSRLKVDLKSAQLMESISKNYYLYFLDKHE